jgi:drug/metabolite transporter (DMT)-like permease
VISRGRGLGELVAAAVFFGLMAFAAKHATKSLPGAETAFVRFAIGAAVVLVVAAVRRRPLRVVRTDLLFLRGLLGGTAVLCYFVAIEHLPVGTATLYNYTAPVFTMVFAAVFLREIVPAANVLALVMTGAGVALVVLGQGRAIGGAYGWQALGLVSALVSGAAVTAIRAARRTDGAWEVLGAFCLVGMLATAPLALHGWKSPTPALWGMLLVVGLLAAAGQILMTHALVAVDAPTAGIVAQLTVVIALILGSAVDGEPFGRLSWIGALLTLAGVSLTSAIAR